MRPSTQFRHDYCKAAMNSNHPTVEKLGTKLNKLAIHILETKATFVEYRDIRHLARRTNPLHGIVVELKATCNKTGE